MLSSALFRIRFPLFVTYLLMGVTACGTSTTIAPTTQGQTPTPTVISQSQRDTQLVYTPHSGDIYFLAWSPDGKSIVTTSADQTAKVAGANNGMTLLTYHEHHSGVAAVAWSPDGKRVATGAGFSASGTSVPGETLVKVWDATTGNTLLTYRGHTSFLNSVAWSPDGNHIASADAAGTVQVWDAQSGKTALTYKGQTGPIGIIAWSPDGKEIVSASNDQTVDVWNASTGTRLVRHHMPDAAWSVAWSPDGKLIASGTANFGGSASNPVVEIWDATTGNVLHTLSGHQLNIWSVNWSPDGKRLSSASGDGTVRIWDPATGQLRYTYMSPNKVFIAAWSPDSKRLASAGSGGSVRIWQPTE